MALRSVQVVLSAATGAYTSAMGNAAQTTDKVGKSLIGIGLAAGAATLVAVKKFADFDQQMSAVEAATHATTDSMNLLRDAAMEAGARTSFSAVEAAQGIEELAKAGVSTTDILAGGLNGALDLAAAGSLGVSEAAEIAATALTQFKLEGQDIPHVADLLAAGAGKAQGSVQDMGAALKQSGLVAAQYGLDIEETTAGLAAFASAGLVGSDAGTSFKSMLQRLTPVSAEASSLMDELGFSAFDANGDFIGLEGVAGELQTSLAGMTVEQRNATMATLFGSDAVRAASVLYDQGAAGIEKWTNKVDDAGYAQETAQIKLNNLSGDLEALSGSFETALIKTGSAGDDFARSAVQWATDLVNAYGEWDESTQSMVLGIGAVTTGVGLTGGALLLLIPRIAATRAAITTFSSSVGAATIALTRLATAAAAFLAVGLVARELGDWSAAGKVAKNETDALAESMASFGESGEFAADTLSLFEGSGGGIAGAFRDTEIRSTTEALDEFAALSREVYENNWFEKIWDLGEGHEGRLQEQIRQIDAGLTKLVESGNAEAAADSLERFLSEMEARGGNVEGLRDQFVGYDAAVAGATDSMDQAQSAADLYTQSLAAQEEQIVQSEEALDALIQSMVDAGMIVLSTRSATRDWEAALDDVTGVLEENGQTLDVTTEAGRANQAMLDTVATSALDLANALYAETGSEEAFRASLSASRESLVETGIRFGLSQEDAETFADSVLNVPSAAAVNVSTPGMVEAQKAVDSLDAQINGLSDKEISIAVGMRTSETIGRPSGRPFAGDGTGGPDFVARAKGGHTPPGMTLVGEEGPELVNFTRPGMVYTAAQSQNLMGIGGPGVERDLRLRGSATGLEGSLAGIMHVVESVTTRARAAAEAARDAAASVGVAGTGPWRTPLGSYRVSSRYGMRNGRMHTGIDLAAPSGSSIGAAAAGRVARSGWAGGYGNLVVLDHGGVQTYYAHMIAKGLGVGNTVQPGTGIGRVGSTGNSTGPHVHFEVRPGGRPTNPAPFMAARGVRFDDGRGILQPGITNVYNGTGGPEPLVDPRRWPSAAGIGGPGLLPAGSSPIGLSRAAVTAGGSVEDVRAIVDAWEESIRLADHYRDRIEAIALIDEARAQIAVDVAEAERERAEALERVAEVQGAGVQGILRAELDLSRAEGEQERVEARIKLGEARAQEAENTAAAVRAADESLVAITDARTAALDRVADAEARLDGMDIAERRLQEQRAIEDLVRSVESLTEAREAAARAAETQLSDLGALLDEEADVRARMADAERAWAKTRADLMVAQREAETAFYAGRARAASDYAATEERILSARRDALRDWVGIADTAAPLTALPVEWLTGNVEAQIGQFEAWMDELAEARSRGVSEDVIATMGLDQGPQALGQLQAFNAATISEIEHLNRVVGERERVAGEQVAREREGRYGQLGDDLSAAQADYQAQVRELQGTFRDAQARLGQEMDEAQQAWLADQAQLVADLAAIGVDQGRSYGEAIAEGMRSTIPAIREAAQALRDAQRGRAAWDKTEIRDGVLTDTRTGRGAFIGPSGEPGYDVQNPPRGSVPWVMPDGRTAYYIPRAARTPPRQAGGSLMPRATTPNWAGTAPAYRPSGQDWQAALRGYRPPGREERNVSVFVQAVPDGPWVRTQARVEIDRHERALMQDVGAR